MSWHDTGMSADDVLRAFAFTVAARPTRGAPSWRRDTEVYTEVEALAVVAAEWERSVETMFADENVQPLFPAAVGERTGNHGEDAEI